MQVFLVRLNDEQARAREIVGIYAAEHLQQLCDMVDEATNVRDCEWSWARAEYTGRNSQASLYHARKSPIGRRCRMTGLMFPRRHH
jgi:hypothetical protein